jgi:hypothetical protein
MRDGQDITGAEERLYCIGPRVTLDFFANCK